MGDKASQPVEVDGKKDEKAAALKEKKDKLMQAGIPEHLIADMFDKQSAIPETIGKRNIIELKKRSTGNIKKWLRENAK